MSADRVWSGADGVATWSAEETFHERTMESADAEYSSAGMFAPALPTTTHLPRWGRSAMPLPQACSVETRGGAWGWGKSDGTCCTAPTWPDKTWQQCPSCSAHTVTRCHTHVEHALHVVFRMTPPRRHARRRNYARAHQQAGAVGDCAKSERSRAAYREAPHADSAVGTGCVHEAHVHCHAQHARPMASELFDARAILRSHPAHTAGTKRAHMHVTPTS
jgi:hypothetical protein